MRFVGSSRNQPLSSQEAEQLSCFQEAGARITDAQWFRIRFVINVYSVRSAADSAWCARPGSRCMPANCCLATSSPTTSWRPRKGGSRTLILMPGYAAPEQYGYVAASRPYTDILSLEATLYHAWIGHPLPPWMHPAAYTGDTQRSRAFVLQDFLYAALPWRGKGRGLERHSYGSLGRR